MRFLPLRLNLTIWTALVAMVGVGLFGTLVAGLIESTEISNCDAELQRVAAAFFEEVAKLPPSVDWEDEKEVRGILGTSVVLYYVELEYPMGRLVYQSPNLEGVPLPRPPFGHGLTGTVHSVRVRVHDFTEFGMRMRIAARLNPVELPRTILLSTYTAAAPIVLIFIAFGAYWIAGRSLRPIARLTAVASAITAQKPGVRLPSVKSEDEVGSLTRVLNRMLERLEASYLQATRFSADASHELRTPLTVIRGEIENRLRKGNLPRDIEDLLVSLMEEAQRLEGITEGLLTLSQADAGNLQLEHERVSLSALIRLVIEDLEILASAQSVQVTADVADDIFVSANAKFLHQMLMNLGENAVKHNRPGGRIAVVLHSDANSIVVSISNTGEPIPKESQGSIFRRFYRSDRSRSRQVPGYGLGLSICWEIAHAHGWDLGLIRSDAEWTTFAVRIPKTVPGTPHSGRTATRHPVGHLPSATTRIVTTPKTGTKRDEKP